MILFDYRFLYTKVANLRLKNFVAKEYLTLFIIALPMGIVTLIASLTLNIPRYFLEHRASIELLGIFGSLIYLISIITKFTNSLSQILSPKLVNAFNKKKFNAFKKLALIGVSLNIFIGLALLIVVYTFGDIIITMIYNESYQEFSEELLYLSFYGLLMFVGGFIGNILTSMRVFKVQIYIHLFKLFTVSVASFILIDDKLHGAITVLIIGSSFSLILYSLLTVFWYKKGRV